MDLNKTDGTKWHSTDFNSDVIHDDSISELANGESQDEKHSDNSITEPICNEKNDDENDIVINVEDGLLYAMNNLQITSVKKSHSFREPMMPRKDSSHNDDKKIMNEEKPTEVQTMISEAVENEITNMKSTAMKLLSTKPTKNIPKAVSPKLLSKSKSRIDASMNHSTSNHTIRTIANTKNGIQVKEEKINFFGIPVTINRTKRTQVRPFNFQNRINGNQTLQESTTKSIDPSTLINSSNISVTTTKILTKSLQNNTKNKESKIPKSNNNEPQKIKQILNEAGSSKLQNFTHINITTRKVIPKTTKTNVTKDKENTMSSNNVIKNPEKKSKLLSIGPKLQTDKRAKDRQEFEAKMKQRTLEIEEMRLRAEQKNREKKRLERITLKKKIGT